MSIIWPESQMIRYGEPGNEFKSGRNAGIDACKEAYAKSSPALVGLDKDVLIAAIVEAMVTENYAFQFCGGNQIDILYYLVDNICKKFGSPAKGMPEELLSAAKEWIQWFDYVSAYQSENLGKGLKEAEENWNNMHTPNPSPSIDRLKKAVELLTQEEGNK